MTAKLVEDIDAAIEIARNWSPNKAWPKNVTTVMLTLGETKAIRAAIVESDRLQELLSYALPYVTLAAQNGSHLAGELRSTISAALAMTKGGGK